MKKLTFPLALVVAAALSAQPVLAQKGNGNGHGNGKGNSSQVRDRDRDHDDDDRRRDRVRDDDRRESRTYRGSSDRRLQRRVPPGWCIGRGNPHNTVANCGRGNHRYDRRYDPRYNGGVTYDRYGNRTGTGTYDRYGNRTNTGTYSNNRTGYEAWKRDHDLRCRELSRQRPLDLRYQLQVRNQCAAETQEARRRYGV
ncbi:MAG TPA: hypothetical protein VEX86_20600 [Longimicrobium sp.]|nr:hypothetical protein [Longimicrobium sp.]